MVVGWCRSAQCQARSRKQKTSRRAEPKAAPLIRRLGIQAFNLGALCESESFWSTIPVLITGPQGFECPVLFTADPEPAMD
jgi:hypothetical protein